jgi:hypothetical protein
MAWQIETLPSGQVDLTRDGKAVGYDLDLTEALEMVRRRDPDATEVTVIELDGYPIKQRI